MQSAICACRHFQLSLCTVSYLCLQVISLVVSQPSVYRSFQLSLWTLSYICCTGAFNYPYIQSAICVYRYFQLSLVSHLFTGAFSCHYVSPWAHLHMVGMLQFMPNINQPSLPTPFYSVLVSISVSMALSSVFHSINSPNNSPFSDSVLPVLSLPYWSFQLYISLWKFPSALM